MNLIEQLGGYEAVKQAAVNYKNSGDRVTAAGLELQCLEYRRQHNIFEHGDKIIVDWDARQIFTVDLVFPEIRLISALDSSGNKVGNASFDRIKHASDEEIKAGKRRPELDSDTCSDIRNHISPNTVVIDHANCCRIAYEGGQESMKIRIDEVQESNLNLEGECVHLQKRIDTALNLIGNWWHPDVDQKLFLTELERVLQGGDQNLKNTSQTIENTVVEGGAQNALRGGHE